MVRPAGDGRAGHDRALALGEDLEECTAPGQASKPCAFWTVKVGLSVVTWAPLMGLMGTGAGPRGGVGDSGSHRNRIAAGGQRRGDTAERRECPQQRLAKVLMLQ